MQVFGDLQLLVLFDYLVYEGKVGYEIYYGDELWCVIVGCDEGLYFFVVIDVCCVLQVGGGGILVMVVEVCLCFIGLGIVIQYWDFDDVCVDMVFGCGVVFQCFDLFQ